MIRPTVEAEQASAATKKSITSATLIDVVLPGASGRVGARELLSERPSLRVLDMFGPHGKDDRPARNSEPGLAFIQKPFSGEASTRTIRAVLAERRFSETVLPSRASALTRRSAMSSVCPPTADGSVGDRLV